MPAAQGVAGREDQMVYKYAVMHLVDLEAYTVVVVVAAMPLVHQLVKMGEQVGAVLSGLFGLVQHDNSQVPALVHHKQYHK
jgi:hypothetical protein